MMLGAGSSPTLPAASTRISIYELVKYSQAGIAAAGASSIEESVFFHRTQEGRTMWWRLDLFGMWDGVPIGYRYAFVILVLGGIVLLIGAALKKQRSRSKDRH